MKTMPHLFIYAAILGVITLVLPSDTRIPLWAVCASQFLVAAYFAMLGNKHGRSERFVPRPTMSRWVPAILLVPLLSCSMAGAQSTQPNGHYWDAAAKQWKQGYVNQWTAVMPQRTLSFTKLSGFDPLLTYDVTVNGEMFPRCTEVAMTLRDHVLSFKDERVRSHVVGYATPWSAVEHVTPEVGDEVSSPAEAAAAVLTPGEVVEQRLKQIRFWLEYYVKKNLKDGHAEFVFGGLQTKEDGAIERVLNEYRKIGWTVTAETTTDNPKLAHHIRYVFSKSDTAPPAREARSAYGDASKHQVLWAQMYGAQVKAVDQLKQQLAPPVHSTRALDECLTIVQRIEADAQGGTRILRDARELKDILESMRGAE
jgi:hypothetical protein